MTEPSARTRIADGVWRAAFRVAYRLQQVYWFVFRPEGNGVFVAVWCRGRLLIVELSYKAPPTLPGGGAKRGEPFDHGAARELAEETGIRVRPEALAFAGEVRSRSTYLRDRCHVFEIDFEDPPEVRIDRREVVAAAFRTPDEALAGPIAALVRRYLTELPAGRARSGRA